MNEGEEAAWGAAGTLSTTRCFASLSMTRWGEEAAWGRSWCASSQKGLYDEACHPQHQAGDSR